MTEGEKHQFLKLNQENLKAGLSFLYRCNFLYRIVHAAQVLQTCIKFSEQPAD